MCSQWNTPTIWVQRPITCWRQQMQLLTYDQIHPSVFVSIFMIPEFTIQALIRWLSDRSSASKTAPAFWMLWLPFVERLGKWLPCKPEVFPRTTPILDFFAELLKIWKNCAAISWIGIASMSHAFELDSQSCFDMTWKIIAYLFMLIIDQFITYVGCCLRECVLQTGCPCFHA